MSCKRTHHKDETLGRSEHTTPTSSSLRTGNQTLVRLMSSSSDRPVHQDLDSSSDSEIQVLDSPLTPEPYIPEPPVVTISDDDDDEHQTHKPLTRHRDSFSGERLALMRMRATRVLDSCTGCDHQLNHDNDLMDVTGDTETDVLLSRVVHKQNNSRLSIPVIQTLALIFWSEAELIHSRRQTCAYFYARVPNGLRLQLLPHIRTFCHLIRTLDAMEESEWVATGRRLQLYRGLVSLRHRLMTQQDFEPGVRVQSHGDQSDDRVQHQAVPSLTHLASKAAAKVMSDILSGYWINDCDA